MKLKLLLLFALLCAVPTLAAGNSVDFSTGNFSSGSVSGSFSTALNVNIVGSLNTIDIITGSLISTKVGCPPDSMCFNFTGGSVKVSNASGTEFSDSLSGGITIRENGSASIDAVLSPTMSVTTGTATASFGFSGTKITAGSEDVSFITHSVVPEPGSLSLLGMGLLSLGASLKTKLWRKNVRSKAATV